MGLVYVNKIGIKSGQNIDQLKPDTRKVKTGLF